MKTGFVKISIDEYDTLIIDKHSKLIQLMKQAQRLEELENELNDKKQYLDKMARASRFTEDFLEKVNPKLVSEWRNYLELAEEVEDDE